MPSSRVNIPRYKLHCATVLVVVPCHTRWCGGQFGSAIGFGEIHVGACVTTRDCHGLRCDAGKIGKSLAVERNASVRVLLVREVLVPDGRSWWDRNCAWFRRRSRRLWRRTRRPAASRSRLEPAFGLTTAIFDPSSKVVSRLIGSVLEPNCVARAQLDLIAIPHSLPLLGVGEEARALHPCPQRLALGGQGLDVVEVRNEAQRTCRRPAPASRSARARCAVPVAARSAARTLGFA